MPTKHLLRGVLIILIVILNIGCDQVSKKIVRDRINPYETIHFAGDRVTLTNVENTGAFMSLGHSLSQATKNIVLSILPILVLGYVLYYALTRRTIPRLTLVGLCCIVGGGTGNLFDRVMYGSVTDFMHIDLGLFRTGIFNIADLSIVTGTILVMIGTFRKDKPVAIA